MIREIPQTAIDLVSQFEGCKLEAYLDVVGVPTIGYGSTKGVELGMVITKEEALQKLQQDLEEAAKAVCRLIKTPLNDNQFSALIDFCYNLGAGALQRSTLRMKLNNGHYKLAANEFMAWTKANGVKLAGLVRRRAVEKELFLS